MPVVEITIDLSFVERDRSPSRSTLDTVRR